MRGFLDDSREELSSAQVVRGPTQPMASMLKLNCVISIFVPVRAPITFAICVSSGDGVWAKPEMVDGKTTEVEGIQR